MTVESTYVTPRSADMAILNAMNEVRAVEAESGTRMPDDTMSRIILFHLRNFFGDRIFVMQIQKTLTLHRLIQLVCEDRHSADEVQQVLDERNAS